MLRDRQVFLHVDKALYDHPLCVCVCVCTRARARCHRGDRGVKKKYSLLGVRRHIEWVFLRGDMPSPSLGCHG